MPILLVTILVFFVHKQLHLEPATVALAGATAMLVVTSQKIEDALSGIEWSTLFFFIALFIMVGALAVNKTIGKVAQGVASATVPMAECSGKRLRDPLGPMASPAKV